jgi:RNA polymerase sigma-70 factor (ECF subfamily)
MNYRPENKKTPMKCVAQLRTWQTLAFRGVPCQNASHPGTKAGYPNRLSDPLPSGGCDMYTTHVSLLERLRQPDQQAAWTRFVQLYTPLLYYWARRKGLQEQAAEDLVQEVFVVLVKKLPEFSYDRHKSFRGWLRKITLNKWRDDCRRVARAPKIVDEAVLANLPDSEDGDAFEEAEYRQHLVARALQLIQVEFRPTTWKAYWEHVVGGRPAAEVAAELGISENAVYVATSKVARRLREELNGLLD